MNFTKFFQHLFCTLMMFSSQATFAEGEMKFVPIPAGEFVMGSPEGEKYRDGSEDQVKVKLTRDFEMQATEVTQLQWFKVMGENPSHFKSEEHCEDEHWVITNSKGTHELCRNHPVERVSWNEVQDFIRELNRKKNDGYIYRLPTEAEWEYAARAGTMTAYSFGSKSSNLSNYGWYWENSNGTTHKVGQKRSNLWGLYDVHGNVWEWVQDYFVHDLPGGTDPLQSSGRYRIVRGGNWGIFAKYLRSAGRFVGDSGDRSSGVGFRLVRVPAQP